MSKPKNMTPEQEAAWKLRKRESDQLYKKNNRAHLREVQRLYYEKNKTTYNERSASWAKENRERANETRRQWGIKNPGKFREYQSRYVAENYELVCESAAHFRANQKDRVKVHEETHSRKRRDEKSTAHFFQMLEAMHQISKLAKPPTSETNETE